MPAFACDGELVGPLEIADTPETRTKGLLGRTALEGALLIKPCRSVHTFGMKMAIDVAFCDKTMRVIDVVPNMKPGRFGLPRWKAAAVLEAESGSFDRWNLKPGSHLEIRQ